MALLEILTIPDPRLRVPCLPVDRFDDDLKRFAADLAETMYAAPGVGLAAAQVGDRRRVVVVDCAPEGETDLITLVNPVIVEREGETDFEEGCLSLPGYFEMVHRAARVVVAYQDVDGTPRRVEGTGLLGVCLQHEIDHLDGKLFIDHLEPRFAKVAQRVVDRTLREQSRARERGENAPPPKRSLGADEERRRD